MIFSQRNSPSLHARKRVFSVSATADGARLDRCLVELLPFSGREFKRESNPGKCFSMEHRPRRRKSCAWVTRSSGANRCRCRANPRALRRCSWKSCLKTSSSSCSTSPQGQSFIPGGGHGNGTLVSGLLHRFGRLSNIGGVERPGIVHRLDKETSGCLVVAKTDRAYRSLAAQFAGREVIKTAWHSFPHPHRAAASSTRRWPGIR